MLNSMNNMVSNNVNETNDNKKSIPRMRTLPKCYEELKKLDPDTCISMRGLRKIIGSGDVSTVKINNKVLVNFDLLVSYLSCYTDSATGA